jgi:transketolase
LVIKLRNSFAKKILEMAQKDPSIVLITGDLGYGVLDDFAKTLPNQYINAGVTEQSMMSMAAGLASQGFRPFVYSIANFPIFRCFEQIRNDVSYMENPVTVVAVGAGLSYGNLGYSHHAIEDIAAVRSLSNISIHSPCDGKEVETSLDLIMSALKPSYLRLGKGGEKDISDQVLGNLTLERGNVNSDGSIIFTGSIGSRALLAKEILEKNGVSPSFISCHSLSDNSIRELLEIVGKFPIMVVEEHSKVGGLGSWIIETAEEMNLDLRVSRMDLRNHSISKLGDHSFLLDEAGFTSENIAKSFLNLVQN